MKFGCKIKDRGYTIVIWRLFPLSPDGLRGALTDIGQVTDINNCEIIGRDILSSDVMAAIDKKTRHANGWEELCVLMSGCISDAEDPNCPFSQKAYWNLLRPSLDDQEEATVNLIYEILCPTK